MEKEDRMILTPVYSLLSLNVLCGTWLDPVPIQRIHRQISKIQDLKPDIICLQEFNNPTVEYLYRKNLQQSYDFHVFYVSHFELLRRISICLLLIFSFANIDKYVYFLFTAFLFNPYVFNFIIGKQKTGNIIITHKDIQKDISKPYCHEFKYQRGDFLNIMRKRGYIDIHLNNTLTIRNTHLNHYDKYQNNHQMTECLENLSSPTLLVGDFNSENIIPILAHQFTDTTKSLGHTYRKNNKYAKYFTNNKKIDYIFSKNVSIVTAHKLDLESDHDALFVEFHLYPYIDSNKLMTGTTTAKKHNILATDLE